MATIAAEWVTLRRGGGEFRVTGKPDHTERSAPAVDLQGHDDAGEIFVEHTQIEPMENRIRTSHTLRTMFPKGGVPVDDPIGNRFFLVFDISDLARVKSPVAAAAELHEWVRQCFADGSAQDLAITNEIAFAASGRPQGSLGAVLIWGVIGLLAAIRGFRWQPRES